MWITVVVALTLLVVGVGLLYRLLKSMGENGIEAAAPGSCRSGRCGVSPQSEPSCGCASSPSAVPLERMPIDEITRKDALSSRQTL